jgi:BirA family biotin operon repressor/biotin-[acetyl-CoA-carboxylase] ligase
MTNSLLLRPAVGMRQIVAVPYVVALGACEARPNTAIAWPYGLVDSSTGEEVGSIKAHAGYDEGMFVRVELDLPEDVSAQLQDRVDAWAMALAGRPVVGPLAPVLADYAERIHNLGSSVEVVYPNGKVRARGTFAGIDVWGRATVRLPDGDEMEFPPEQFGIR